ncbi:hypothetical protein [Salinispora arenicola]|uniref:hypothetical protein n=1 Tax=Salinispora arenicola TaxID=168697 RepID=UPI0016AFE720|nr:hypothetical protein [Salinispora arenicola]NIL59714.1 hypothetical protein [Salinispora arenicola]NIL64337.1 hypothetical protein [Salinispora arenicola]
MQVLARQDMSEVARPHIRLRLDRFDLYTRIVGATSDQARARLLGLASRTITRLRRDQHAGEAVIAATLTALQHHSEMLSQLGLSVRFEDLFEVAE